VAITTTSQAAASTLINYVTEEIQVLEPELQFANIGVRKDIPKGFDQLTVPQGNFIATSSVTTIASSSSRSTEGTNPSVTTWGTTGYTAGYTQYGIVVQLSDILMRNSAFELVSSALREVKSSLARQIDNYIQNVVNGAGSTHIYAGGKTSRVSLAAGDLISVSDYTYGIKKLRNAASLAGYPAGLKPFIDGKYGVIMHPNVETDFMNNTGAGAWVDLSRYSQTERLDTGKINGFRGGVVMTSANVQTFSSTTTVYPTTFIGKESFVWGYFQVPTPILVTTPDSYNQLNLFESIGGKAAVAATTLESSRIVVLESAAIN
jgi:N4-gp56 family major capsid protein